MPAAIDANGFQDEIEEGEMRPVVMPAWRRTDVASSRRSQGA